MSMGCYTAYVFLPRYTHQVLHYFNVLWVNTGIRDEMEKEIISCMIRRGTCLAIIDHRYEDKWVSEVYCSLNRSMCIFITQSCRWKHEWASTTLSNLQENSTSRHLLFDNTINPIFYLPLTYRCYFLLFSWIKGNVHFIRDYTHCHYFVESVDQQWFDAGTWINCPETSVKSCHHWTRMS